MHCIHEISIYDNSGKEYPVTAQETVHELKQAATEQFQFFYTRATDFLQAAINLYQERK
jgi:pyruvate/oxaloacetate carboxyltransferase